MLGFIIRIQSVTDGGLYKCSDADGQADEIYNLEVSETCELKLKLFFVTISINCVCGVYF